MTVENPHDSGGEPDQELIRAARAGADRVLRECLCLRSGETLGLFYDETTEMCARLLIDAARPQQIEVIQRRVPITRQIEIGAAGRLSRKDSEVLSRSRGVLLCLGSSVRATLYRKLLVKEGLGFGPFGTMPGATLEALAHAINVDYADAKRRCGDLAVALLIGDCASLTSYIFDREGRIKDERILTLHLGGFERSPITSPGVIADGTWGNLPGGETFIAPLEGRAEGVFVLNGAFKGHVLKPWCPIFLHFHKGELVKVDGAEPEAEALREMLRAAIPPHLFLAELGIGINPGIPELKGNALFDEKKAGTVHVAVGDNEEYGGRLSSSIHEDFISCSPSLRVDGKPILDRGQWSFRASDWREDAVQALELGRSLPRKLMVQRRTTSAYLDDQGRLTVRRDVGTKRVCIYTLGMDELSADLARAYLCIPDSEERILFELLRREYERRFEWVEPYYLRGLLAVLEKHHLAAVLEED